MVVLAIGACTRHTVELVGRTCPDEECTDGFVCNPLTDICTMPVATDCSNPDAVCPSATSTGDGCDLAGSFLPCADETTTCESGCRLCQADNSWSACSNCVLTNGGVEVCDGFDNDCDGVIDGIDIPGCIDSWVDADGDLFGTGEPVCYCGVPPGRARYGGDPDDTNKNITPGGPCDGVDSGVAFALETDDDGDGYVECQPWIGTTPGIIGGGDCADDDPESYPGAPELCDGVSDACAATIPANETDSDGDMYVGCAQWVDRHLLYPTIKGGGDCGPSDPDVHPGAIEVWDNKDDDCDGKVDECLTDCDCGTALVSCYPLDTLPIAIDQGPAGVTASVTSGSGALITGVVGNAYAINDTYVVEGPSSTAHDLTRFSLSVFVRPTAMPIGTAVAEIVDVQSQYGIKVAKSGNTTCYYANNATTYAVETVNTALSTGFWQHVGCTYDGKNLKLYVGGVYLNQHGSAPVPYTAKSGPLRIGSNSPEPTDTALEAFTGAIDHLKIFNRALSAQEMCVEGHRIDC